MTSPTPAAVKRTSLLCALRAAFVPFVFRFSVSLPLIFVSLANAQGGAGEISGNVKAGNTPLPGVSIAATNTLTGQKVITSTELDGSFRLSVPANGRYVVRAELAAFAPLTKEVIINAASPSATVSMELQLRSRV